MLSNLLRILFPDFCIHCGRPLVGDERHLCSDCMINTPWANEAHAKDNSTEMRLAGRFHFVSAASLMHFQKGNVAQSIVHNIKYHGHPSLAVQYGRLLGRELKQSGRFCDIDYIVPVPLHWFRKMRRGYNQSELICIGISKELGVPLAKHYLRRKKYTKTQTHKNRDERQQNMQQVFAVRHPKQLQNKHILLVDDIITTGATTDSCHHALQSIHGLRISVAALALVKQD